LKPSEGSRSRTRKSPFFLERWIHTKCSPEWMYGLPLACRFAEYTIPRYDHDKHMQSGANRKYVDIVCTLLAVRSLLGPSLRGIAWSVFAAIDLWARGQSLVQKVCKCRDRAISRSGHCTGEISGREIPVRHHLVEVGHGMPRTGSERWRDRLWFRKSAISIRER
jgi:hypothetical protein